MIIDFPNANLLPELRELWREAFGDSEEFFDLFKESAYSSDRCRVLMLDGAVAAALYWFSCEYDGKKAAYLYAIATQRAHRGKGLCRALMDNTHAHLRALGYDAAILVPSEPSLFGFYERMGYSTCSSVGEFSCLASDKSISLSRIGKAEYARLRREYLPLKSVIQENENLDFLIAQADLYKGDGILLAASVQGDRLLGIELLGSIEAAPEVVRSLGCESGDFRTVGGSRPFAMYLPLSDKGAAPPTYFGLAFD